MSQAYVPDPHSVLTPVKATICIERIASLLLSRCEACHKPVDIHAGGRVYIIRITFLFDRARYRNSRSVHAGVSGHSRPVCTYRELFCSEAE